jgi:hypothetical protein
MLHSLGVEPASLTLRWAGDARGREYRPVLWGASQLLHDTERGDTPRHALPPDPGGGGAGVDVC